MEARVKMVDKLENEGKTYNIYIKGNFLVNLTLEGGRELTNEIAVGIAKDIAKQYKVSPDRVKPEEITFEEAKPEFD